MLIQGEIDFAISYSGSCSFLPAIVLEEDRVDSDTGQPTSFDVGLSFDTSRWDAITAPERWTRGRIAYLGADLVKLRAGSVVTLTRTFNVGDLDTLEFAPFGSQFGMSTVDPVLVPADPCPTPVFVVGPGTMSPLAWGNKLTECFLGLASTPANLKETKIFQGRSFQKNTSGDAAIVGAYSAVDDSLLYSQIPVCFQLAPFSGLRRGAIVKLIAASLGIDPTTVTVPVGEIVTKPIQLSNGRLIQFIADFGIGENWYPKFDEFGHLVVIDVEVKDVPDFTLDATKGDLDLDTFQETIPQSAPSRYYVTSTQPVQNGGPDGTSDERTTRTTEEIQELYAPLTVKVRPSGGTSYLYGDGSYRAIPAQELMVVQRKVTDATTVNGIPTRGVESLYQFYNMAAKDPNYDTSTTGTNYNDAYGDKTFHKDEVESLQLVSEITTEATTDQFGTVQKQVVTTRGPYAPHAAQKYVEWWPRKFLVSAPGQFVFPGSTFRTLVVEELMMTARVTTAYAYGPDGTILETNEDTEGWFSPPSRCDISTVADIPNIPPITSPSPPGNPSPPQPPYPAAPWRPALSGPTRTGADFFFSMDVSSAPDPSGASSTGFLIDFSYLTELGSHDIISGANGSAYAIGPSDWFDGGNKLLNFKVPMYPTLKPFGFAYALVTVTAIITGGPNGGSFRSQPLQFDPWAGLPSGSDLRSV